jgi:hypothetical protein
LWFFKFIKRPLILKMRFHFIFYNPASFIVEKNSLKVFDTGSYRHRQRCGSGMFYPRSRFRPFSHPGSRSKLLFIPDPGSYMKSRMQTYFFLAYAFRSEGLVLIIIKKIRDPEKIHPGYRIQGVKKHLSPDPGLQHWAPV